MRLDLVDEGRIQRFLYPEAERIQAERPRTRSDCIDGPRPCPWVGCRHHMYLTVDERDGAITLNFPHTEVWDLKHSCALDVADRELDGLSLEDIGGMHDLTRERTRQIELSALENMDGEVGAEPVKQGPVATRSRQHRRSAKAIARMSVVMLKLARARNSTSIRAFVATLEHARSLADVARVITVYLADDPQFDVRAVRALRGLACAASESDPMAWPMHLLDVNRELAALEVELSPGKPGHLQQA